MGSQYERRSAEQWRQLLNEFKMGSETDREFCRVRGLGLSSFRKWRYRLDRADSGTAAQAVRRQGFAKVVPPSNQSAQAPVIVRVGDAIRIECPASLGIESIARLALAIRDGR